MLSAFQADNMMTPCEGHFLMNIVILHGVGGYYVYVGADILCVA